MKIIKENGNEKIWFSPKRFIEIVNEVLTSKIYKEAVYYQFDNNQYECLHRKTGPAMTSSEGKYLIWYLHNIEYRIDGPSYIDLRNNKKSYFNSLEKGYCSEEAYWND